MRFPKRGVLIAAIVFACGCAKKASISNSQAHEHHEEAVVHKEEEPASARFKVGEGILLSPETRANIGLEIVDVARRDLAGELPISIQVFDQKHRHAGIDTNHTDCDVHGSALIPNSSASLLNKGSFVIATPKDGPAATGRVVAVQNTSAGETELVIGLTNAADRLHPGEFASASIVFPARKSVLSIPTSALLRTASGTFVYLALGEWYLRAPVKTGADTGDFVEIVEGLREGDRMVLKPVETLWLIELRATKGGGHSH